MIQEQHNDYHTSQPDFVFLFDQKVVVISATDEQPNQEEDESTNQLSDHEVHEQAPEILTAHIGCAELQIFKYLPLGRIEAIT